jgi:hypothetical protein
MKSAIGQFFYSDKPEAGKVVACFESWFGGKSALYLVSEDGQDAVDRFIEDHFKSGSDSILRRFDDEFDASITYNKY